METDNKPSAPPSEPIKPIPSNEERISFSFHELTFDDSFTSDNRKFLRFFVSQENPFFIDVLKIEYIQYFDLYTELFSKQMEKESCSCDICSPQFEKFDDLEITTVLRNGEEEKEINESFPLYYVWDLPNTLICGIKEHEDYKE